MHSSDVEHFRVFITRLSRAFVETLQLLEEEEVVAPAHLKAWGGFFVSMCFLSFLYFVNLFLC